MSTLPKPELRGYLARYIGRSIAGAACFASFNCACYYYFYMLPRKKAYAEFHKTFNSEEHCKFMAKYGYLESTANK